MFLQGKDLPGTKSCVLWEAAKVVMSGKTMSNLCLTGPKVRDRKQNQNS